MTETHILLISSRADVGGGPKHVYDLATHLKKNSKYKMFFSLPINQHYGFELLSLMNNSMELFYNLPFRKINFLKLIGLAIFCKKNKISIIHSHGRAAGVYSRLLKILLGVRVIHTFHGVEKPENIKIKLIYIIEKLLNILTDHYICVASSEKDRAKKYLGISNSKISIVPNGIQTNRIRCGYAKYRPKNDEPIKYFGILSRLENNPKNIDIALQTIAALPSIYHLIIAGDGPDKNNLTNLAIKLKVQNRVHFIGEINDINNFFASIDYYISLSKTESLPYSVLEALSAHKYCYLSDIDGHKELDFECITLLPINNIKEIVNMILNSKPTVNVQKTDDRLKKYSISEMGSSIEKIYDTYGQ